MIEINSALDTMCIIEPKEAYRRKYLQQKTAREVKFLRYFIGRKTIFTLHIQLAGLSHKLLCAESV